MSPDIYQGPTHDEVVSIPEAIRVTLSFTAPRALWGEPYGLATLRKLAEKAADRFHEMIRRDGLPD